MHQFQPDVQSHTEKRLESSDCFCAGKKKCLLAVGPIWSWYEEKLIQSLSSGLIEWTQQRQKTAIVLAPSNQAALGFCITTRSKTKGFLWIRPSVLGWYFTGCWITSIEIATTYFYSIHDTEKLNFTTPLWLFLDINIIVHIWGKLGTNVTCFISYYITIWNTLHMLLLIFGWRDVFAIISNKHSSFIFTFYVFIFPTVNNLQKWINANPVLLKQQAPLHSWITVVLCVLQPCSGDV